MITAAEFKQFRKESRSIRIELKDGRKLNVPHGEHLSLQPAGSEFLVWRKDGGIELLNLEMVKSITVKVAGKQQPKS